MSESVQFGSTSAFEAVDRAGADTAAIIVNKVNATKEKNGTLQRCLEAETLAVGLLYFVLWT